MSNEEKKSVETTQTVQVKTPEVKDLLKAGVQFGHETKRWNPKMRKFIFGSKNNIHIIDVNQTETRLADAVKFLTEAAKNGNVLFVGTKRQASDIVMSEAIRSGSFFINSRWAGGLLTNFAVVKKSLDKLNHLEKLLEEGVEDRTKYEVSRMKKEWQRLNRLYAGIKSLQSKPTAVVVVDVNFEKAAIREARKINVPIVALIDSNSDPEVADYVIPANDDAISSLKLLVGALADAVISGNGGKGVKHNLQDYSKMEVKITKKTTGEVEEEKKEELAPLGDQASSQPEEPSRKEMVDKKPAPRSRGKVKGILERVKEEADTKKKKTTK